MKAKSENKRRKVGKHEVSMRRSIVIACWTFTAWTMLLGRPAQADAPAASAPAPVDSDPQQAKYTSEATWDVAGYNNEEVVYTILITSHDTRILRCTTELSGFYFEDGKKQSVSDRQVSTVFPDQQVQVGNWMGMDQKSGTSYSVQCRPL